MFLCTPGLVAEKSTKSTPTTHPRPIINDTGCKKRKHREGTHRGGAQKESTAREHPRVLQSSRRFAPNYPRRFPHVPPHMISPPHVHVHVHLTAAPKSSPEFCSSELHHRRQFRPPARRAATAGPEKVFSERRLERALC